MTFKAVTSLSLLLLHCSVLGMGVYVCMHALGRLCSGERPSVLLLGMLSLVICHHNSASWPPLAGVLPCWSL